MADVISLFSGHQNLEDLLSGFEVGSTDTSVNIKHVSTILIKTDELKDFILAETADLACNSLGNWGFVRQGEVKGVLVFDIGCVLTSYQLASGSCWYWGIVSSVEQVVVNNVDSFGVVGQVG